jgi:hypothetical protein
MAISLWIRLLHPFPLLTLYIHQSECLIIITQRAKCTRELAVVAIDSYRFFPEFPIDLCCLLKMTLPYQNIPEKFAFIARSH